MESMNPSEGGWIEVICGCMYSGKTEELIRRLRRARIANQNVLIVKPIIDNRFEDDYLVSHSEQKIRSVAIQTEKEIPALAEECRVIGIDEVQFFSEDVVEICHSLADHGKRVIIAGLDQDYRGVPFEPIPQLLASAEYITKTLAICMQCGRPANRTQRIIQDSQRVLIGGKGIYEARCRKCHTVPEE